MTARQTPSRPGAPLESLNWRIRCRGGSGTFLFPANRFAEEIIFAVGVPPPVLNASLPAEGGSNVDAVGLICCDDRRLRVRCLPQAASALCLQYPDQSACRLCDAVDHRPEVATASHNIMKSHLPTRCRRWIDETWRGLPQEFKYFQTAGYRDHELAIRGQKALSAAAMALSFAGLLPSAQGRVGSRPSSLRRMHDQRFHSGLNSSGSANLSRWPSAGKISPIRPPRAALRSLASGLYRRQGHKWRQVRLSQGTARVRPRR